MWPTDLTVGAVGPTCVWSGRTFSRLFWRVQTKEARLVCDWWDQDSFSINIFILFFLKNLNRFKKKFLGKMTWKAVVRVGGAHHPMSLFQCRITRTEIEWAGQVWSHYYIFQNLVAFSRTGINYSYSDKVFSISFSILVGLWLYFIPFIWFFLFYNSFEGNCLLIVYTAVSITFTYAKHDWLIKILRFRLCSVWRF